MSATIISDVSATEAGTGDDPFALDLRVITDIPSDHPLAGCKGNTDDGCDPTCASSCISEVM